MIQELTLTVLFVLFQLTTQTDTDLDLFLFHMTEQARIHNWLGNRSGLTTDQGYFTQGLQVPCSLNLYQFRSYFSS